MDQEKTLRFKAEGREFAKKNQVATTIYSSSEKSEVRTIFETERSFDFFFETLKMSIGTNIQDVETYRNKQEKIFSKSSSQQFPNILAKYSDSEIPNWGQVLIYVNTYLGFHKQPLWYSFFLFKILKSSTWIRKEKKHQSLLCVTIVCRNYELSWLFTNRPDK